MVVGVKARGGRSDLEETRLDRVFHALGDSTRRGLLARLADGEERVTNLAKPFPISLPAVSKHLRVLEDAGLISRSIEGRVHRCKLEVSALREAEIWVAEKRLFWEQTLDSLAEHVEEPPRG